MKTKERTLPLGLKLFVCSMMLCCLCLSGIAQTIWNGTAPAADAAATFSGGAGTQASPYRISTAADLAQLAVNVNAGTAYASSYFTLTADLDMTAGQWMGIGSASGANSNNSSYSTTHPFQGLFEGNGHTVLLAFSSTSSATPMGLFGCLAAGAQISRVNVAGSISCNRQVGAIAGIVQCANHSDNVVISGCGNAATLTATGSYSSNFAGNCGGMVGMQVIGTLSVDHCYNMGDLSGSARSMAMVGIITNNSASVSLTISDCYNKGALNIRDNNLKLSGCMTFSNSRSAFITTTRCYNLSTYVTANTTFNPIAITDEGDFASGALAWTMNNGEFPSSSASYRWAQGANGYPVLASTGTAPAYRVSVVGASPLYTAADGTLINAAASTDALYFSTADQSMVSTSAIFSDNAELLQLAIAVSVANEQQLNLVATLDGTVMTATGSSPYRYSLTYGGNVYSFYATLQWQDNGAAIAGATAPTLSQALTMNHTYKVLLSVAASAAMTPVAATLTASYAYGFSVVYVDATDGNDTRDGTTPATAVKTLLQAYALLPSTGTWNTNIIVLMNTVATGSTLYTQNEAETATPPAAYAKNVTLTGSYDGADYPAVLNVDMSSTAIHKYFWGNTRMEHLTINGNVTNNALRFYMQGHDFYAGEGIAVTGCRSLPTNDATVGAIDLTASGITFQDLSILGGWQNYNGDYADATALPYASGHVCHITLMSGNYGRVVGGGRNELSSSSGYNAASKNIFGHPDRPWGVEITVGGTANVNLLAGGQCDGTVYANSIVNIQTAGVVGRLLGGSLAYSRTIPDVPSNTFFGTSTINISAGTVYELYGGSLGRGNRNDNTIQDNTFYYGKVRVNISGGTVKGDIYAAGAGGMMGYHPDNGDAYKANAANYITSTKVSISGSAVIEQDVYGGGYGYSQYLTSGQIQPLGGGFFGNDSVMVSGGHVLGSVYGGGKGYSYGSGRTAVAQTEGRTYVEMTGGAVDGSLYGAGLGISGYPTIARHRGFTQVVFAGGTLGGNIYGGGNVASVLCDQVTEYRTVSSPITTATVTGCHTEAIVEDGNHVHDVYGGGNESTVTGDTYARMMTGAAVTGNFYGGGLHGAVTGNTHVVMTGGAVNGSLYGGGMEGAVVGTSHAEMTGGTVDGFLYGGGYQGDVTGTSYATMTGGHLLHSLLGGGHQAAVSSDTFVEVRGNAVIDRNVYGGGNAGIVHGNTHVKIGANP